MKSFAVKVYYDQGGNISSITPINLDPEILEKDFLINNEEGKQNFLELIAKSRPPIINSHGTVSYKLVNTRELNFRQGGFAFEDLLYEKQLS
jgi:hypothetical protein